MTDLTWPAGVGPHPGLVDGLAHLILEEITEFAATVGWPLPERVYVAPGAPPWDCAQVTVHVDAQAGHAGTATEPATEAWVAAAPWALASVLVEVQVVRCLTSWEPNGSRLSLDQLPSTDVDEADAYLHHGDVQVVRSALINATNQGRLSADGDWAFVGAQSLAEGDLVGQVIRFIFGAEALHLVVDVGS